MGMFLMGVTFAQQASEGPNPVGKIGELGQQVRACGHVSAECLRERALSPRPR